MFGEMAGFLCNFNLSIILNINVNPIWFLRLGCFHHNRFILLHALGMRCRIYQGKSLVRAIGNSNNVRKPFSVPGVNQIKKVSTSETSDWTRLSMAC